MSVIRTVPALTFCLTLLGAPTVHAGSSNGRVDAHTLPKLTHHLRQADGGRL